MKVLCYSLSCSVRILCYTAQRVLWNTEQSIANIVIYRIKHTEYCYIQNKAQGILWYTEDNTDTQNKAQKIHIVKHRRHQKEYLTYRTEKTYSLLHTMLCVSEGKGVGSRLANGGEICVWRLVPQLNKIARESTNNRIKLKVAGAVPRGWSSD